MRTRFPSWVTSMATAMKTAECWNFVQSRASPLPTPCFSRKPDSKRLGDTHALNTAMCWTMSWCARRTSDMYYTPGSCQVLTVTQTIGSSGLQSGSHTSRQSRKGSHRPRNSTSNSYWQRTTCLRRNSMSSSAMKNCQVRSSIRISSGSA